MKDMGNYFLSIVTCLHRENRSSPSMTGENCWQFKTIINNQSCWGIAHVGDCVCNMFLIYPDEPLNCTLLPENVYAKVNIRSLGMGRVHNSFLLLLEQNNAKKLPGQGSIPPLADPSIHHDCQIRQDQKFKPSMRATIPFVFPRKNPVKSSSCAGFSFIT